MSDSLGHVRIGTTADVYIDPADEQKRLKARMLDGFLYGSNTPPNAPRKLRYSSGTRACDCVRKPP